MAEKTFPTYKLFGESSYWKGGETIHCEKIHDRSRLHNHKIRPHRHNDLLQIVLILKSPAEAIIEGNKHFIDQSALVLVPPLVVHGFSVGPKVEGYVLSLYQPFVEQLLQDSRELLPALSNVKLRTLNKTDAARLAAWVSEIHDEYISSNPGRMLKIYANLSLLLVWIARARDRQLLSYQDDRFRKRMRFLNELIEEHYRDNRPVSFYAREIGISTVQLNNSCQREAGKSCRALLHDRLLLEASRYLAHTNMQITEMAYMLGFKDPAYFTRFFQRATGQTPSRFRLERRTGYSEAP